MDKEILFQQIRALKLPFGTYALFGSAPMCIRGLKEFDHDIESSLLGTFGNITEIKDGKLKRCITEANISAVVILSSGKTGSQATGMLPS